MMNGKDNRGSGKVRQRFTAALLRQWQANSKRVSRSWAPLICLILLVVYAAVLLQALPWVSTSTDGSSLRVAFRLGLFRPSYCSALPANFVKGSSSAAQALDHSIPSAEAASATTAVPEAVLRAFLAVHAAADQSLQLAGAIWHSRGQPDADLQLCSKHTKKKQKGALKPPMQQPSTGPEVAPVVTHLNLSAILSGVGDYPAGSSSGRGIVVVGGGPKYTPAAFGCVYFIRRTGSQLPIEVWAPPHEPIHPAVAADFIAMGNVSVRSLHDAFTLAAHDNMQDRKFLAKQLSILASQFQEILFLDADNIPLRDPAFLFDEPLYKQHGLLMWPDFWRSQAKPGAWDALGVPPELRPPGSHESGQGLIDKKRAWKPLLLAVYFNMRGDVFDPLFSDMGQGDKETLPFAWLALGFGKYGLVQHGVLALGYFTPKHTHDGTAMLQRSPDGIPMFLHAHMPKIDVPKERIKLPPASRRKWEVLTGEITAFPPQLNATSLQGKTSSYEVLNAVAGYDLEVEALQLRRYLRCQPAWVACCLQ